MSLKPRNAVWIWKGSKKYDLPFAFSSRILQYFFLSIVSMTLLTSKGVICKDFFRNKSWKMIYFQKLFCFKNVEYLKMILTI